MDQEKLIAEMMPGFLEELSEHVAVLTTDLIALEKIKDAKKRQETIDNLFRAAHSLKGAAKSMSIHPIADFCHVLEDVLVLVRSQRLELSLPLTELVLRSADRIDEAGMQLREEQPLDTAFFADIAPLLVSAQKGQLSEDQVAAITHAASTPNASNAASPPEAADTEEKEEKLDGNGREAQAAEGTGRRRKRGIAASVRVAAEKLDALMAHSGELLVARRRVESRSNDLVTARELVARWHDEWRNLESGVREMIREQDGHNLTYSRLARKANHFLDSSHERFSELERKLDKLATHMTADGRNLGQVCDSLEEEVLRVRMLPFAEACNGLERAVRDAALSTEKKVELVLVGQDVEVDRSVLEALKDPLLHLVRNAVDHGLEAPADREQAGKSHMGRITVEAALRGGQVEVTVSDDGRGLDLERIRNKLAKRGMHQPHDERELARSVFLPGFSTAAMVTDISGRGVGLDVVQAQIESLHGNVDISFESGKGTHFKLIVPLTLTTVRSVLARFEEQVYVFPTASVEQFIRFGEGEIGSVAGRDVLIRKTQQAAVGEAPIPIVSLGEILGTKKPLSAANDGQRLAIVISSGALRVGVIVDEVIAEQEITIKSLGPRVHRMKHVSGATLLPSGRIALVLNIANVVRTALAVESFGIRSKEQTEIEEKKHRLLVVDDSITTRSLIKSILETSGYEVRVAVDGRQAQDILENETFDAVVSDVDMPRVNGFELAKSIRSSRRLRHLPIVLVTARSTEEDRARGIEAGANAYITKGGFDQSRLLETVSMML